jgi:phosphoribosylamine-glycine ligase
MIRLLRQECWNRSNKVTNVDVSITDFEAIKVFCSAEKVEMIVGPEDPLVKGI